MVHPPRAGGIEAEEIAQLPAAASLRLALEVALLVLGIGIDERKLIVLTALVGRVVSDVEIRAGVGRGENPLSAHRVVVRGRQRENQRGPAQKRSDFRPATPVPRPL